MSFEDRRTSNRLILTFYRVNRFEPFLPLISFPSTVLQKTRLGARARARFKARYVLFLVLLVYL